MSSPAFNAGFNPLTVEGTYVDQGMQGLVDFGNKYKDNEVIGGQVAGTIMDTYKTQINTGLSLGYNKALSSHLNSLTQANENLRTANSLKLMGAEGRIAKDLIGAQGEQQRMGIRETGAQQRMNIGAQGTQDRMNLRTKGSEDRKSLVTAGQQERLNIGKRYSEERNMRADARGAIRSTGARFFG